MIGLEQQIYNALLIFLSVLSGAIIGNERQHSGHKEAGRRTMSLISLGACLFTIIPTMSKIPGDPWRMASAIVTGIGFLGSGVVNKDSGIIKGLTTASAIWVAAALGICFGCGEIIMGIVITIVVYFILRTSKNKDTITDNILNK